VAFETDCILIVEGAETFEAGVGLKAIERLGRRVNRRLAPALGFLQVGEVTVLDPLVFSVVHRHQLLVGVRSHGLGRVPCAALLARDRVEVVVSGFSLRLSLLLPCGGRINSPGKKLSGIVSRLPCVLERHVGIDPE